MNYAGMALVIIYTIWNVIYQQQYLSSVIPTSSVSFWTQSYYQGTDPRFNTSDFQLFQDEHYANQSTVGLSESYKYCNNEDYNVEVPPDFSFKSMDCAYYDHEMMSAKTSSKLDVFTTANNVYVSFFPANNASECTQEAFLAKGLDCNSEGVVSLRVGKCYCRADNSHLLVGAENITVVIEHTYRSEYKSGELPKTHVRRAGSFEDFEVFHKGQQIQLPMWRWLEIAEVDLDTRNTEVVPGVWNGSSVSPYLRISGVMLDVQLLYYNYKSSPGKKDKDDVTCTIYVKAYPLWASTGNNVDFERQPKEAMFQDSPGMYTNQVKFGISMKVSGSGAIYRFDLSTLITALTQTTVLLGVVALIVSNVAFSLLGVVSQSYKEVAKTTFNFEREYARFAANAIVAAKSFKEMDVSGDGYIHRQEIFEALKSMFTGKSSCSPMSEEDLKVLTEFVLRETDDAVDKTRRIGDGRVSQEEWVDIVTSDTTNSPSLMRIINGMKTEEKQKFIDRFEGVHAEVEQKHVAISGSTESKTAV